jgi:16S rRNA pseudouridine516 synthase
MNMALFRTVIRLDRFLSSATALSRSQAQKAIRGGRVRVDGVEVKQVAAPVSLDAAVSLDESAVAPPLPRYFMLNKPVGVVCATEDPSHRTAIDLLDQPNPAGLHFAGRLDIDATGLVLITDDGDWSHRIVSPTRHCEKRYRVALERNLSEGDIRRLEEGVLLRGEKRPTRAAKLRSVGSTEWQITITEGRYHQVKRMFAAVGNRVEALHREAIGGLVLDPQLKAGEYRALTGREVFLAAGS